MLKTQLRSYDEILQAETEIRKLRHDIRHLASAAFFEQGNALSKALETPFPVNTKSTALNSALNIKRKEAVSQQIGFQQTLNFTRVPDIEETDLYLLLSNILDNAIRHIVPKKQIRAVVLEEKNMFVIRVANTFESMHKTQTPASQDHGCGLATIRQIVNQYNGMLTIASDDNIYSVQIIFPLKESI